MKLLTVMVNYKTAEMTLRSVGSLITALELVSSSQIVVVDNDSGDGSFERIRAGVDSAGWADKVRVVASPKNGGFGYGNNVGIRLYLEQPDPPEYIYLLNTDAFPETDAVVALVEFLDAHPQVGIAGSLVYSEGQKDRYGAFRFPSLASEFDRGLNVGVVSKILKRWTITMPIPSEPIEAGWVSGSSMMIRSKVLREIGLFDEGFFLYFEETDLCRRSRNAGWPVWFAPQSKVLHLEGSTTGTTLSKRPSPAWYQSRTRYFHKHHKKPYFVSANLLWLCGFTVHRARCFVQQKDPSEYQGLLADFLRYGVIPRR